MGGVRAGRGSAVTLYDFVAEKPHGAVELPCHVHGLAGIDGAVFAAGSDGLVRRITTATPAVDLEFRAHPGACLAIAVDKDRVATVGDDGVLRVFARADGKLQRELPLSSRPLRVVAFDAPGDQIAVGGDDGVVRVVARDGAVREMAGHDGPVYGLAFTPAADRVVSAGDDGTLRIWFLVGPVDSDVRGAGEAGHAGGATGVWFLPGASEVGAERFVSCGVDGRLKVWRMNERRKPRSFDTSGNKPLHALVYVARREGGAVVTAGDARTVWAFPFDDAATPVERAPTAYGHGFDVFDAALQAPAVPRRTEAVKALAVLDEPEALELVIKALGSDRDPGVRGLAANELAIHRRIGAIRPLRARLDDAQASVRLTAFTALRSLQSDAPLAAIRAALAASAVDVRQLAVKALPELAAASPLAVGLLIERLADPDPTVRRAALSAYRGIEPAGSPLPLRAAFERGAPDVRADALAVVAEDRLTAAPEFAPLVEKALDDADPVVRRVAFVAVALTRPVLARWLEGNDPMFAQELTELARRVVSFGTGAEAVDALDIARPKLLPPGAGGTPSEDDRQPLLAALACRTPDTALRGARGLALLQDLRALGALLTLTRESDGDLRQLAADALAALPDPRARRRITWMLDDREARVRDAALRILSKLEQPLDLAERALRSSQEDIRQRGLVTLVQHGKGLDRGEELLADSLDDEAAKVRTEAFRTFWAWHQGEPLVAIDRALIARFPDVRKRAIDELLGLAKLPDSPIRATAVDRMVTAIADLDERVAKAAHAAAIELEGEGFARAHTAAMGSTLPAIRTLGATGARKSQADAVRHPLIQRLDDADPSVRRAAIDALDALFPTDNEAVRAGLRVSHLDTRVRAAEHLAIRRDTAVVEPMMALLRDPDLERRCTAQVRAALRLGAASALATVGSPTLLEAYANELVKDDDGFVREQGARGLANACRPSDTAYLIALLGHADVAVRSWGAEGLARLGDPRGLPVLTGTLRHEHAPIRVGAILSFAALGPEGYGGLLQGLEDPSPEVQRILLVVVLARDLTAYRKGEPPELLSSALASARHEVRFAAARALELRSEPGAYLAHLVDVLLPDKPEKAPEPPWPDEDERGRLMVGLALALASDVAEQRYAALQTLRLRDRPALYFREAGRVAKPRMASAAWVPETTPRGPAEDARPNPLQSLRRLFAGASDAPPPAVGADEQAHLYRVAFGAYVGLLRQVSTDDETHRVRRDVIDRVADLVVSGRVALASAVPSLARALDDPHHLVRRSAFAALKRLYPDDPETPLALALLASSPDVLRSALDDLAARGAGAFPRIAKALDSNVADARKYAFEVLERISPKGSLEPLLAALRSQHADLRIGVLERLASSQDPRVFEALTSALLSDHEDLRLRAAELLAVRRDDRAVDVLEGALRSEEHGERARSALAKIGSPAAVRAFGNRFADGADPATGPQEHERLALISALGQVRSPEAIDLLVERFTDESISVRQTAFVTCMEIAGPRPDLPVDRSEPAPRLRDAALAFRALEPAARAKGAELRAMAAAELDVAGPKGTASPEADAVLRTLFADRDKDVRVTAVRSYASRVEHRAADPAPLVALVAAGSRELTLPAAAALAIRRPDPTQTAAVFRALLLYVRAGEPEERPAAILGLGALGDLRALAELEQIAAGGTEEVPVEPEMQAAAVEALGKLYAVVDPDVRERIRDRIEASLATHKTVESGARALVHVGGERSRTRLESLLDGGAWSTRVIAAEGLGKLGDPAAEKALAGQLEVWYSELRWAAYDALVALFPTEPVRIAVHAVKSGQDDLAQPAAAYLADHADAKALLAVLNDLEDDDLRERLRFGLVNRPEVAGADLAALLGGESAVSRADAAWVVGNRPPPPAADRKVIDDALAAAVERARRGWELAADGGEDEVREQEERAWRMALWAGRRLNPERIRPVAAATLSRPEAPVSVRVESAHALRGSRDPALAVGMAASSSEVRFAAVSASGSATGGSGPADPVALGRATDVATLDDDALATGASRVVWLPVAVRSHRIGGLIEAARSGVGRDRVDAIGALGLTADPEAAEVLAELAGDDGAPEDVRKAAFRASRRVARNQVREQRARSGRTEASP
ncbi:MAG: HEAT repeat domain-containing protein [Myxococcota bacterium]